MLLLLVISVAITGFAVFGKSIMWYLDGKKKEAPSLLFLTIGFFALILFFCYSRSRFLMGFSKHESDIIKNPVSLKRDFFLA